jgi:hypothetical protein
MALSVARTGMAMRSVRAMGLGLCLALGACDNEPTSLVIRGIGIPEADNDCTITPSATTLTRPAGTLDVGLTQQYEAWVVVANQLTPRGRKNNLRTETSGVVLEGAEVRVEDSQGAVLIEFTAAASGFIDASGSETPGFGAASATLIPPQHASELAAELASDPNRIINRVAYVKVYGHTVGGVELESVEFAFPIRVCLFCLVDYSAATVDVASGTLQCVPTPGSEEEALPCDPGQDEPVDCRQCAALEGCRFP